MLLFRWQIWLLTAVGAGFSVFCPPGLHAAEDLKLIPDNVSLWNDSLLWDKLFNVRAGVGYKDNVLLSPFRPAGSPFFDGTVQATVMRLPSDGWQFWFFLQGQDIRYFHPVLNVDHEETLMALAQINVDLGPSWRASSAVLYYYLDQVQDVSITEASMTSARVLGHTLTVRPGLRRDFSTNWWVELQMPITRQFLKTPLDCYWQTGPKLIAAREYGRHADLQLSYRFAWNLYDKREPFDAAGGALTGTRLTFSQHKTELQWRHLWGKQQHWRTATQLGFDANNDNGGGFFDYQTYRASEQISYENRSLAVKGKATLAYYDYPIRTIGLTGSPLLHRTLVTLNLRAEKRLAPFLKIFGEYEYEQALSNENDERYRVNTVRGGLEFEF